MRFDETEQTEYTTLMSYSRRTESTAQLCWIGSGIAAATLLSWAIAGRDPGLMLPVVLAVAFGFYARLRGRQQVRLIGGYVEEFLESPDAGGPMWFTRVSRLHSVPSFQPTGDWLVVCLANATVVVAVALAWLFASHGARGDLMAGIVTGCAGPFVLHSISETSRLRQTSYASLWRQTAGETTEFKRPARMASR